MVGKVFLVNSCVDSGINIDKYCLLVCYAHLNPLHQIMKITIWFPVAEQQLPTAPPKRMSQIHHVYVTDEVSFPSSEKLRVELIRADSAVATLEI